MYFVNVRLLPLKALKVFKAQFAVDEIHHLTAFAMSHTQNTEIAVL